MRTARFELAHKLPDYEALTGFDLTVEAVGSRGTRVTRTFLISITNVNEPPIVVLGSLLAREDSATPFEGLSITDPDTDVNSFRVQLAVEHGTLTVSSGAGVTVTQNASATVTLSGTLAAINALLARADGVTYRPLAGHLGCRYLHGHSRRRWKHRGGVGQTLCA